MEPDYYNDKVLLCLDALPEGRANVALDELDDYQKAVVECFQTLMQGPPEASATHMNALLHRFDDLIDAGTDLGVKASVLVETLYGVRDSIAVELEKGLDDPEARKMLRDYLSLRELMRSPVLRAATKEAATVERESRIAGFVNRFRRMFRKG